MVRLLKPTLLGILLVDVPVFTGVVSAGLVWGFRDSFVAYFAWREEHPWTFVASLLMVIGFVLWRSSRRTSAHPAAVRHSRR